MAEQSKTTKGQLKSTKRSLLQDAELAIGNDPVRALIELITNSDDAYGKGNGKITVEISRARKEWAFAVRDRACGMRAHEIGTKLLSLGERTSGFEAGDTVRGNLGRGAKDVSVFGNARFETIKDNRYTRCEITRANEFELWPEVDADGGHRRRLGIPSGNGTVVKVTVQNKARCPQFNTLVQRLSNDYQLRDILVDPKRTLQLKNSAGKSRTLRFSYPDREMVVNTQLDLPDYPDGRPQLVIYRFKNKPENPGPTAPTRLPGILVKGEKAIYQNTLFAGENLQNGSWFCGECECPFIDLLIRDYDDSGDTDRDAGNPMGLIRRDRTGLQVEHPFFKSLSEEINNVLLPLIKEEDKKQQGSKAKISDRLSRDLNRLGRELGKMFVADTEDTDVDQPGLPDVHGLDAKIQIIPGRIVVYLGEAKTVTVRVGDDVSAAKIQVQSSPEQLIEISNGPKIKLNQGKATLSIFPLAIGSGALTVRAANVLESVLFEVRRERPAPPPPPKQLEFERENYTVRPGRQKRIKVVAPESVVLEHGEVVNVSIKGDAIVKLGPSLRLLPNDEDFFEAVMTVEARENSGSVSIKAHVGDTSARCRARIAKEEDASSPTFKIEIRDGEAGPHRALIDGNIIWIQGKHAAVRRVLGKGPEFKHQNEPMGRASIAEIVAFEITKKVVEAKFKNREDVDAGQIYYTHVYTFANYLRKCQRLLHLG